MWQLILIKGSTTVKHPFPWRLKCPKPKQAQKDLSFVKNNTKKEMAFSIPQFQARSIIAASASTSGSGSRPKIRPARTSSLQSSKSQPSISEIERAIGVTPDQPVHSPSDINSSIMDFLGKTPIGREGPAEKALREAAEKFTDHAEAHTASAHRFVLELFIKMLPLYILAMAVASGWIKLPFDVPFIDELIM
ncbi:hypothetical protein LUZ63_004332 [Rhynchospora breviuscula]|uniref:Chlororespiratory reduction 3 n=1 Tax=Rhynchospora breviuscula TaxID=2022672 RepID=A0A9Q0D2Z2_9POAL|nr:hypothetical protein LUZ63_004332 [Rhynchospora breviuscula]